MALSTGTKRERKGGMLVGLRASGRGFDLGKIKHDMSSSALWASWER